MVIWDQKQRDIVGRQLSQLFPFHNFVLFLKSIALTTTVFHVKCYPLLFSKFLQRQIHKQHHSKADIVHFVDKGELRLQLSLHLFLFHSVSPAVGRMSKVTHSGSVESSVSRAFSKKGSTFETRRNDSHPDDTINVSKAI